MKTLLLASAIVSLPGLALAQSGGSDGFKVGDATVKITGYVKGEALFTSYEDGDTATNSLGRDFYLPSSIPVSGAEEDVDFDAHAKQTRLAITVSRTVGGLAVGGYVEGDFQSAPGTQGSERTTNAYNFAMRRAYVTAGSWLVGQDWSTFQNVGVMPETTDFIGPTEGTVFVRQTQVRKTFALSDGANLQVSLENPETAYINAGGTALNEPDDDTLPDAVVRFNGKAGKAEFSVAGLVRQLSYDDGSNGDEEIGLGVSFAGKVPLGSRDDIRFMVTTGEGIGRYVGLNFAGDAVLEGAGPTLSLETTSLVSGFAALRHYWSANLRSTFAFSFITVDNPDSIGGGANDEASSFFANLFYSPVRGLDLGAEVRRGSRETVSGAEGEMSRLHFVAKTTF